MPINLLRKTLPHDASVDIYVVSSLADFGRMPFLLSLPPKGHTPAAAIAPKCRRELEKAWNRSFAIRTRGEAIGDRQPRNDRTICRRMTPPERPEMAAAFAGGRPGGGTTGLRPVGRVTQADRNACSPIATIAGGGPTKTFTQGATWVSTSLDLPPKDVAIRVVVQSPDAAAAAALESELTKLLTTVGQLPPVQKALPEFDELSKKLLPMVSGDQLKLDLTEANGGIAALTTFAGRSCGRLAAGVTPKR